MRYWCDRIWRVSTFNALGKERTTSCGNKQYLPKQQVHAALPARSFRSKRDPPTKG